eukprot:scaffold1037_cov165-Ochromonas_danica.AAC.2
MLYMLYYLKLFTKYSTAIISNTTGVASFSSSSVPNIAGNGVEALSTIELKSARLCALQSRIKAGQYYNDINVMGVIKEVAPIKGAETDEKLGVGD